MNLSTNKQILQNTLIVGIWFFTAAFFLAQDAKAQRGIFFLLLVIPFLFTFSTKWISIYKRPEFALVIAYFILLLLSIFWSIELNHETRLDKIFINAFSTLFFFFIFHRYFFESGYTQFISVFCICGVVTALYSLISFYSDAPFPDARLRSMLRDLHPNITGSYFSISCIFLLYLFIKLPNKNLGKYVVFIFSGLLLLLCVILTHSRGAMLILFCGLVTFIILYKPKLIVAFFISGALVLAFYWLFEPVLVENLIARGSSGRDVIRERLLNNYSSNIIIGQGIVSNEAVSFAGHAHSSYLSTYLKLGIIGLGIYFSLLATAFYFAVSIFRKTKNWLPLTWLLMGSVNLLVEGTELIRPYHIEWVQFWLPVALCFAVYHSLERINKSSST